MASLEDVANATHHRLFKRRWLMLLLFVIFAFNGSLQWTQFTIISNLVTKYYNVTTTQVEWTANVFILSFILFAIPSLYLIEFLGVRYVMVLASFGIACGSWIKLFSVAQDRFYLAFIGQCFSAACLRLTYGLFGRITAIWFGANEISMAGVLVVMGDHVGSAFGFFFSAMLVKDGAVETIGEGLRNVHLCVTISSSVIFFLILFFFQSEPKTPPSLAQIKQKQIKQEKILPTLIKMMKNPVILLFIVSFGLNIVSLTSSVICLNEIIVKNFPDASIKDVGNIGFLMMLTGIVSSLFVGKMLDKTRLFKEFAVLLTICTAISLCIFTWSLKSGNILFVYAGGILIGFFSTGYYSSGMQLGIELTYPIQEEISTTITFLSGGFFSLIFAVVYGYAIKEYGELKSNIGLIGLNCISVIATLVMPVELKRQRAENEAKRGELEGFRE